ncbi:MAG: Trk system potassium transporter TrkA [Oscillospiraceae bacterium]|nr:Trk system potassium transporter TrkA [Oscillospiraceae bacterium]
MNIVVAGGGKVGGELIQQLTQEGHSVTVIDVSASRIEEMNGQYDVMGYVGNCATLQVMQDAQVEKADLLIATTASDEQNLLACLLARKMGAKHTIARVRDPQYVGQMEFLAEELGLSMYVNPEYSAASEIFRLLRFPSAQKLEVFAGGRVEIVEVTLPEGSGLTGIPLRDLPRTFGAHILVCAVQRGDEVCIPKGDFVIRDGDRISITAEPNEMTRVFKKWGLLRKKVDNVMLVGGGLISYYLGRMLCGIGAGTMIVERDEARCRELCEQLPAATIIQGDGTDHELLGEVGIHNMDGVVALTGSDEENIILGMYADSLGEARKVVVKVNNGNLVRLGERAGLESVLSPKHITANMILRYVRGMSNSLDSNVEALHSICSGQVEALEFSVGRQADGVAGIPLKDLKLRRDLLLACIIRAGRAIIPGGSDVIRQGDHVLVVTTAEGLNDLTDILE